MTVPTVHLDDASVEAIARRVVELMGGGQGSEDWIDAAEAARRFSLSRDYVYEHADALGAMRLGDGPKARLRFDPATVAEKLSCSDDGQLHREVQSVRTVRKRRDVALLPIRGESL